MHRRYSWRSQNTLIQNLNFNVFINIKVHEKSFFQERRKREREKINLACNMIRIYKVRYFNVFIIVDFQYTEMSAG